ncbi:MAG: hypothetical protein FJZ63_01470 [Chlamydiae bacterium]|nr:hypothetical protein [Chlamydiota bacterium]
MEKFFLSKLKANFPLPIGYSSMYCGYVNSIETLVDRIATPIFFEGEDSTEPDKDRLGVYFQRFHDKVPFISYSPFDSEHPCISVTLICSTHHTHGVGRFMCDFYSRWLVPGKQIPIVGTRSLAFRFEHHPNQTYYLNEIILYILDAQDIPLIKSNLQPLSNELKINILAVQHTRHVISIKSLSLDQKKLLIQENISSLLDRSSKEIETSLWEYANQLTTKCLAEDKVTQIKDQISPLLDLKPTAFDRDIYSEMHQFVTHLKDDFTSSHEIKHINRLISYNYIFRKIVRNGLASEPTKRHISAKALLTTLHLTTSHCPILGILVCLNFLNDHEIFEEKHLFNAVLSILPDCHLIPQSTISDRRGSKRICSLYIEVKKEHHIPFTGKEIKDIKKKISIEIEDKVEGLVHPVFIHRNEEEIMKNIVDLSRQLKYIHDLPQLIVNFHKQTSFEISFILILLKIRKNKEPPLKEIFSQCPTILKIYHHDIKDVGFVRKSYPKEAHVLEIRLDKKQFLRKDFSVDLYKARLCVVSEITRLVGDVRDYNGGMIAKQYETLSALKALLLEEGVHNDFLLENFFYSLTPNYMQSILPPLLLKKFFFQLLAVLEHEFSKDTFRISSCVHEDYYILMLGAVKASFREVVNDIIENLSTAAYEISHTWVTLYDITCVGFLLRYDKAQEYEHFHATVEIAMQQWEKNIKTQQAEQSSLSFLSELVDQH